MNMDMIKSLVADTSVKVQANKAQLESFIKSGLYTSTAIREEEKRIHQKNDELIQSLKVKLAEIKQQEIEKGQQKDIERGQMPDMEVANMLSVLSISAKTIHEPELIKLYERGYFNPMLKMAIEAVAAERRYTLVEPMSGANEAQQAFRKAVKAYVGELPLADINRGYEVISAMMSV